MTYETVKPFLYVQKLFVDNGAEEKAEKFELIESHEQYRLNLSHQNSRFTKHFYLYMQITGEQSYIKVYSIQFNFESSAPNKFTVSPVKKVRYIEDSMNMWSHNFVQFDHSVAEFYNSFSDIFADENIIIHRRDREVLRQNLNVTNEAVDPDEHRKVEYPVYLNYQGHKYMMIEAKFKDAVIIQDKTGRFFRLFLGKECVFEFTLKEEVFRHKLLPGEQGNLKDIVNGVFRIECSRQSRTGTSTRIIHLDKGMPVINDAFTTTLLRVFLSVYDSKIYHTLVRDIILNCLNFNTLYANPVTFDIDDVMNCNFKETNSESYIRLTTYFAYLLSVDESTKQLIGQWNDLSFSSHPRLAESLANSEMKKARSSSEEPDSGTKENAGDIAWRLLQRSTATDKELGEVADLFDELEFEEIIDQKPAVPPKENSIKTFMPKVSLTMEMFSQFRVKFFKYLHLLYEDLKLNIMMKDFTEKLGFFLYCYSSFLNVANVSNYIEYYSRDYYTFPFDFVALESLQLIDKIVKRKTKPASLANFSSTFETEEKLFELEMLEEEPYDLTKYLSTVASGRDIKRYPILYKRSFFLFSIFLKYFGFKEDRYFKIFKRNFNLSDGLTESAQLSVPVHRVYFALDEKAQVEQRMNSLISRLNLKSKCSKAIDDIYLTMIFSGFRQPSLSTFSSSVRIVLETIIRDIRQSLPSYIFNPCLPKGAYTLINREDIHMNIMLYPKVRPIRSAGGQHAQGGNSYLNHASFVDRNTSMLSDRTSNDVYYSNYSHLKEDKKDFRPAAGNDEMGSKRMAGYLEQLNNIKTDDNDLVFNEIQRMLNISDLIRVKAKYIEQASDEAEKMEHDAEAQVLLRKFAIRRMSVLIGRGAVTVNTDRSLFTEVLHIPKINFNALIESSNRKLSLEKKDENINWPEFHSGVAVGLKIPREILNQKNKDTLRTWIDYQKTNYESYDKLGLIYALGLQGLLYCFLPTDIYLYLKPFYEPRSIGIMLGLAASKIGSRDENIMKAVAVHLACLLPSNTDLQLAMTVECAALVSIGLLYKGTCNKQFSQIMLREIMAKPNKEKNFERESYSLSAGFALGLINLGKGKHLSMKMDSSLDSELLRMVEGGKLPQRDPANKHCSNIKEGDFINTQLVAPSALMALAFIYMKSENQQIANKISIPTFFYEIEHCNPNHILLKVLARNLIMWNKITASDKFIHEQIPPLIKMIVEKKIEEIYDKCYSTMDIEEIDFSGITLIYYNIIAGCVLSLAMKYAGSGDLRAKGIIIDEINKLRKLKIIKNDFASDQSSKNKLELYNLFNLFSIHCLSLSIIMAGTMDSECLKVIRIIRKKLQYQYHSHYGFNMAIHMAIGFLGLGSGGYTFGRDEMDIASLLISVYPHFPLEVNDNQYHLQALRHFYALAVKANLFHSIDIDTGESVRVKFKIEVGMDHDPSGLSSKQSYTPILLQGSNHWKSVVLLDPDYSNTKFSFERFTDGFIPRLLFVRKKFSHEINKKALERLMVKQRIIAAEDIKRKDLNKMFGNHLYNFIYRMLQQYSEGQLILGDENRRYLGLPQSNQTPTTLGPQRQYHFDCNELLKVCFDALENNRPYFIYEYIQYILTGSQGEYNLFSVFKNLLSLPRDRIDDVRLMLKHYSQVVREGKGVSLKHYDAHLYKIMNDLRQRVHFTTEEKLAMKNTVDHLRTKARLPEITTQFKKKSAYRDMAAKLKLNEVALSTVVLKVVNNCRAVKDQLGLDSRFSATDRARVSEIISDHPLVKEHGLADLIGPLIE